MFDVEEVWGLGRKVVMLCRKRECGQAGGKIVTTDDREEVDHSPKDLVGSYLVITQDADALPMS